MAEINSTEVIVQPIVPKAVDNQQVIVYIPTANTGSYGAIKLETDDLNPDIIAVNGIIQLRNGRVLQTKVDVIEVPECVYATPNTFIPYTEFASENTIVYRNEDGNFNSGDAKLDSNVVNLRVLKQEIGKALVEYDSINIQNGTGTSSIQQKQDGTSGTFDFTGKNPNATAIDNTLTGQIAYGATGNFATAFGGKSQASGKRSFAAGTTTIAKGDYSHAEGSNTVALGVSSHTEGSETVTQEQASHAEGNMTQAIGKASHSEGTSTKASAENAHAEGWLTEATAQGSHSEGIRTYAKGVASHSEGSNNFIENSIPAGGGGGGGGYPTDLVDRDANRGLGAHVEGGSNTIYGYCAHAEGEGNYVYAHGAHAEGGATIAGKIDGTGDYSHSEGYYTKAEGKYSHAEGTNSTAGGEASHVEGSGNSALGDYSHAGGHNSGVTSNGKNSFVHGEGLGTEYQNQAVFGTYNKDEYHARFIIGNGTSERNRSNAFEVLTDGRASVQSAPVNSIDVVRKQELDTKYDKTGGTIGGNVVITGNLTVNGTQHINNTENFNVENAMIYSNAKGATLATNGGIGIKKNATDVYGIVYDPTSDSVKLGLGKSDANGKFTFNTDEGQPVAIRDDSSKLTNGHLVQWDGTNHKLVDGGKAIEDLIVKSDFNIQNGTGTSSVQQKQDGTSGAFDFTGKNSNATAIDSTLTGQISYGATGNFAASFGGKGAAQGKRSFQAGTTTIAKGNYSAVFGDNSVALGNDSFAAGYQTTTVGAAAASFGDQTVAQGKAALVTGVLSKANGEASFAGGYNTIADGEYSFTAGSNTAAVAESSAAFGDHTTAGGKASFATGTKNNSTGLSSDVSGGYNTVEGKYASARGASNFIKASYPTDISGGGGSSSGGSGGSTEEPTETLTPGAYSSVEGNRNTVYGAWSHARGSNNVIYSHCSTAEGYNNIVGKPVTSINDAGVVTASQHAEGANNKVTGDYSHVGGYESEVSGKKSFVHGQYNNVSGNASAAFGGTNSVSGDFSGAFGSQNVVGGTNCLVAGSNNTISKNDRTQNSIVAGSQNLADYSNGLVVGNGLVLTNDNQAVFGTYNALNGNSLLMVGNGTSERNRSNAFEVLTDGRAKVQTGPVDDNDVVRKLELDSISSNRAVTINAPASATQGTLTEEQLSILQAGDNNYIIFNNEIYRLADKQHTTGILSYTHIGWTGTAMQDKSINITISTLAWTLVIGQEGGGGTNVVANPGTGTTRITDIQIGNTKYYILPKKYEQYLKDNTFVAPNVQLNVTFITSTVKDGKYLYKQLVACNISHKEIQNDATLLKNLTLYLRGTAIANDIPVSLDTVATILSSYSFTTDTSTNIFKLLLPYNDVDTEQSVYAEKVVDAGYALWYGAGDAPSRLDSTNIKNVISKGTKNISVTTTASQKITILFPGTVTAKTNASFSTEIPLTKTGTVQLPIYSGSSGAAELAGAVIYNIYQTEPLKAGANNIILTLGGN